MSPLFESRDRITHFTRRIASGLMVLRVNMTRCDVVLKEPHPYRVWCVTSFQVPDAEGLAGEAEGRMIEQAEREILQRIPNDGMTVYLGYMQHDRRHVMVLQSKTPEPLAPAPASRLRGSLYVWDVYTQEDPNNLFVKRKMIPTRKELRRIRDAETIQTLVDAKDNPDVPRPITFYALFTSREAADGAASALGRGGFRVGSAPSEMPGKGQKNWSLSVTKTSQTDSASIEKCSAAVDEACQAFGGVYDGWSCEPINY